MSSFAPFLPSLLRELLARGRVRERQIAAALLFADVSGFTSLTEKLAGSGREGAEEIARVINRVFRPAIRAIAGEGGTILSFGGDAVFAMFPGGVKRAEAAAEAVRDHFRKRGKVATSHGLVELSVSQAIHFGNVRELHLDGERRDAGAGGRGACGGKSADRRHYLVVGSPVQALARLEARAEAGEILLSRQAKQQRARERRRGQRALAPAKPDAKMLAGYLDPRLRGALRGFRGGFRRAAVLFLETKGAGRAALDGWFGALCDVLDRYDGMLLKSDLSPAGIKWICLFGIPRAHENDPDRAARAALELAARPPRGLSLRAGLHGGTVANIVIGTGFRKSFDVMGDAVNTAARAMGKAAYGEILVTEELRRQLTGARTRSRGKQRVKGKKEPLHLHALRAMETGVKELHVSAPMIGRDRELATIVEALGKAREGKGGVIGIKGEAGMGKSRLKYEAAKKAREMGFALHEGRAVTFKGMVYWTIGALIRDALGLPEAAEKEAVLARVSKAAKELGLKNVDRHHLAEVLGARYPKSPIEQLDAKAARLNNNLAVKAYLAALAAKQPRLVVLEDMHWADGGSIEAVEWLARAAAGSAMLVLLLYRTGSEGAAGRPASGVSDDLAGRHGAAASDDAAGRHAYDPPKEAVEMALSELPESSAEELLEAHLGLVPKAVGKLVKERAGGNPFYIEELVRHLLETGVLGMSDAGYELTREIRADDLPAGIESLIAARLDRLSPAARDVARHASVIGRSFLPVLLGRLKPVARKVDAGLAELLSRQVIFRKAEEPPEYIFKHALTRDVAYAGMLVSHRRRVHRAVAAAIEELFAGERERYLAILGYHYEQARRPRKARECYLAGARAAVKRYAHDEAEEAYRGYLRLVTRPTEESITARNELGEKVLQRRGRMKEAEEEYRRAIEEAGNIGSRKLEGVGRGNLGWVLQVTGRMEEARALLEQALAISREVGNRSGEGKVLGNLANLHREQGRMEEAQALYEQALAIHREMGDRHFEGSVLANLATLHREQGRMEEARGLYEQAVAISREVGDPRFEGIVLGNLAILHMEQGRMEEARARYEQALAIYREVGDRRFEGHVLGNLANLHVEQGRMEEGRARYEQALAIHREVGNRRGEGIALGNLAGLHHDQGRMEEARALYEQALAIHCEVGNRRVEGIVLGNLAALRMKQGRMEEARALLQQALAIHREVGDRRSEGAVLGNLAILHMEQGRMEEARALYEQALAIDRKVGNRRFEGSVLGNLANLHVEQGRMEEARALYEQALAIHREVGERRFEGTWLGNLADWELVANGDTARAGEFACKGEALLREVGDRMELAKLLRTQGHIQLAGGNSATPLIAESAAIAGELQVRADSDLAKAIARLRRAQAAFEAGEPLVCGHRREDLSEGQLRWLSEHRPEVFQERGGKRGP